MLNNQPLRRSRTRWRNQTHITDSRTSMDMMATRKFMLLLGSQVIQMTWLESCDIGPAIVQGVQYCMSGLVEIATSIKNSEF